MDRKLKVGGLVVLALVPLLIAASGGIPSRPRFLSIGVNATAPATGSLTASGTLTGANVTATAAVQGASLVVTGSSATVNGAAILTAGAGAAGNGLSAAVIKTADTDRSSTVTLAADNHLTGLSVPAVGRYLVEGQLCFIGITTGTQGIKLRYQFSGSTGAGSMGMYVGTANSAVVAAGNFVALNANQVSFGTLAVGSGGDCIQFDHTFNATSTGTLDLQWAQLSSNANATRLLNGSVMRVTRVN